MTIFCASYQMGPLAVEIVPNASCKELQLSIFTNLVESMSDRMPDKVELHLPSYQYLEVRYLFV